MRVRWSANAERDLDVIEAFIGQDNAVAAIEMVLTIIQRVEDTLPAHPSIGRAGRVPGTREFILSRTPYLVPYRVRNKTIEVLRVLHAARRWPNK